MQEPLVQVLTILALPLQVLLVKPDLNVLAVLRRVLLLLVDCRQVLA